MSRRHLLTRRRALAAAGAFVGAGVLEYASLAGAFDHRRFPRDRKGDVRYRTSIHALGNDSALADGAIVHVGHSTHVLSVAGARFLTDPWFFDPAFGALSHIAGPAVAPEDIGPLDAILISHDHADHADIRAVDRMDKSAVAIVATSEFGAKMQAAGFRAVEVLAPWRTISVGHATVTAVPGKHDIYEVGYVVVGAGRSIYFAGDTRLHEDLPAIAERFALSLAILPVDGTRLTGGAMHVMTPDDAVKAAAILRAKLVIPSHAEARFSDPLAGHVLASTIEGAPALFAARMARALPAVPCPVPSPGEVVGVKA
jgi:L-ascorbate metabolism protein UlaG (beta-lactamase superfamily)